MAGLAHGWRSALAIRLTWPVQSATLERLLEGDTRALDADPAFVRLQAILDAGNPLGDFGAYQAVAELAPGWELFRPGASARPALGQPGKAQVSPSVLVTIHVPAEAAGEQLDAALDALIAAHPWEVPVIEMSEVRLAVRSPR
ncbi:MAG: hypothetical protein U1E37_04775 [Sphingomonadaceae bacterium]